MISTGAFAIGGVRGAPSQEHLYNHDGRRQSGYDQRPFTGRATPTMPNLRKKAKKRLGAMSMGRFSSEGGYQGSYTSTG